MAVKIKSVMRVNPQNVAEPNKYYAKAISTGRSDIDRLAKLIAMQCTVNRADCLAVLSALQDNIIMELQDGKIVDLGDIGSFQIGVNSLGHEVSEEVSTSSVKKAKLNFRPGTELKKMIATLSFNKGEAA